MNGRSIILSPAGYHEQWTNILSNRAKNNKSAYHYVEYHLILCKVIVIMLMLKLT